MQRTADISPCGSYRWRLGREWDGGSGKVCFIMLNPSTADASKDDPTLAACIHFAKLWDAAGLDVVNLFPFRSSSPAACFDWVENNTDGEVFTRNLEEVAHAVRGTRFVVAAFIEYPVTNCPSFGGLKTRSFNHDRQTQH